MKKLFCVLLITTLLLSAALCVASCSQKEQPNEALATIEGWQKSYTAGTFGIRSKNDPFVEITFGTDETIRLELYPNVAPLSVQNFITYVEEGFYTGIAFHRIITGAIQFGGYELVDGLYTYKEATHPAIKGEFRANGVNNALSHTRGVISMARSTMDSATSQVFICTEDVTSYDGQYAAFGRVIDEESMAVVSRIGKMETHSETMYHGESSSTAMDAPISRLTIKKAVLVQA